MNVTRKIDDLGRIVIPKDFRKKLDINNPGDEVQVYAEADKIIIKKNKPCCVFCSSQKNLTEFNEKMICEKCLKNIKNI